MELSETLATSTSSFAQLADVCAPYEPYTAIRFSFILCATVIAAAGIAANILLVQIFATRQCPSTPPTHYPSAIAVLDAIICTVYVLIFGIDAIIIYAKTESLFVLYYLYIIPAFVASRIAQLAIPQKHSSATCSFFATLERFVWITAGKTRSEFLQKMYSRTGRQWTLFLSLAFCIVSRLPTFWALKVADYPDCPIFLRTKLTEPADWTIEPTLLASGYYVFDYYFLSFGQSLVPFVILFLLNGVIVFKLHEDQTKSEQKQQFCKSTLNTLAVTYGDYGTETKAGSRSQELCVIQNKENPTSFVALFPALKTNSVQVRSAMYTMLAIVTSYLVSTGLHLILTILERSNSSLIVDPENKEEFTTFHTIFSDTVTFVYML
ncbi:unnamed protein product, partial [Mesorhabditis belari]|uniref:Uncharacterized protein n=1 Tax=Mesorhabditis belari TaxID=2138241 RepID=A0AAF3JAK2_9BILA